LKRKTMGGEKVHVQNVISCGGQTQGTRRGGVNNQKCDKNKRGVGGRLAKKRVNRGEGGQFCPCQMWGNPTT